MLVYIDSCVLIYYLDQVGPLHQRATSRLAQISQADGHIVASDLVRLECRVKPLQVGDNTRLSTFDGFFVGSNVIIAPMSTAVFDRATSIRASHGFKLADSLHLAAAIESSCQVFLTNDNRLSTCTDITIEVLP